ncbi:uncharacterized protein LOC114356505 [Ostrinia furnacalis]|uniref:uncharacterized protein LOC114356505 n=1 Tax=Ostrinia furnacalis TaxID=93504 RepID=UPI00103A2D0A|nr:uncharacterized protein LOC114356505 [Ostrinia furnacalis]
MDQITENLFTSLRSKKGEDEKYQEVLGYLDSGANPNAADPKRKDNRPLHIAVQNSDLKIVELLLDRGADVTLKNGLNKNPYELAKELPEVDEEVVALLQTKFEQLNIVSNEVSRKIQGKNLTHSKKQLGFDKREGTASGIDGQFYESKILSLILFRCLTDATIEYFYLGTNVNNVGALDDVCLRYKIYGESKDRMLFMQAKHRQQDGIAKKVITLDDLKNSNDYKLIKYFESYEQIKNKFKSNKDDIMFKGSYEDVDCDLVLFTPSDNIIERKHKAEKSILRGHRFEKLFCSRKNITFSNINENFQISDVALLQNLIIFKHVEALGELLKAFILTDNEKTYSNMLKKDNIVQKYHALLTQKVIHVGAIEQKRLEEEKPNLTNFGEGTSSQCSIQESKVSGKEIENANLVEKYRKGTFHSSFFDDEDACMRLLKEKLFENNNPSQKGEEKKRKDKSNKKSYETEIEEFKSQKKSFKLPVSFGKLDLTLKKGKEKTRIEYLVRIIIMLANIAKYEKKNVIRIDKNIFCKNKEEEKHVNKGFIDNEGGIAGLVGNLLTFDSETETYQFRDVEKENKTHELEANSKLFLEELNKQCIEQCEEKCKDQCREQCEHKLDIYQFRFDIAIDDFPKLAFYCTEDEKLNANDFLNKYWVLSNQCSQSEIEDILKMEIESQLRQENKNRLLRIQSHAIFLKFHDQVQKWWMKNKKANYKTKMCQYYEKAKKEIVDSPILSVLNFIMLNTIKKNLIKFKSDIIDTLGLQIFMNDPNTNVFNITASEGFLTIIKLAQFFENHGNTAFLDFEYILENKYFEDMKSELQTTELDTFIFLQKNQQNTQNLCQVIDIIKENKKKKCFLVTEKKIVDIVKSQCNVECLWQDDNICDLNSVCDSDDVSRNWTLIFQEEEVKFNRVIEEESKRLINSHILLKLIKGEKIEIGNPLRNIRYNEVKQYCIPRNLDRGEEFMIKSFKDINENVVLIVAEPGMGKSVLMNQLAIQTKEIEHEFSDLSSWILYVNLNDYSSDFSKWPNDNISKEEAIIFICKTAINKLCTNNGAQNIGTRTNVKNAFKIKVDAGNNVQVESFIKDPLVSFELRLFIDYLNRGNLIIIFDGFDEICPQYEKKVICLLKHLTRTFHLPNCELLQPFDPMINVKNVISLLQKTEPSTSKTCNCPRMGANQNRIWVTTRSYNHIKNVLETELGRTGFTLRPLSKHEQTIYLMKYFEINFRISDLKKEEIDNLNIFFDYMLNRLSDESRHITMVSVPLYTVYVTLVSFFHNKFSANPLNCYSDDEVRDLKNKCADVYSVLTSYGPVFERQSNVRALTAVSENPLHLYMAAEYFYSQIKYNESEDQGYDKWDINTESFNLFKKFLDIKFKKILFEQKNYVDPSKSAIEETLENQRLKFVEDHKKMALCAIFNRIDLERLLPESVLDDIDKIMIQINTGKEKTGIIVTVIDKVPRFVHLVFAEYFAIEYICDLLIKSSNSEMSSPDIEELWRFIMNIVLYKASGGVRTFFDHKLRNDSGFMNVINSEQNKKIVFKSFIQQGKENQVVPEGFNFSILKTSLNIAVEENLLDIQNYIFECIQCNLNEENIDEFTELTSNSLLLFSALGSNNDDLIHRFKQCLNNIWDDDDDKFIDFVFPAFVRKILPFKINLQNFMSIWRMVQRMIPQLADVDIDTATEITPNMRSALSDYIKLFWELVTDTYNSQS